MYRRIISFLLCVSLIAVICGCSELQDEPEFSTSDTTPPASDTEPSGSVPPASENTSVPTATEPEIELSPMQNLFCDVSISTSVDDLLALIDQYGLFYSVTDYNTDTRSDDKIRTYKIYEIDFDSFWEVRTEPCVEVRFYFDGEKVVNILSCSVEIKWTGKAYQYYDGTFAGAELADKAAYIGAYACIGGSRYDDDIETVKLIKADGTEAKSDYIRCSAPKDALVYILQRVRS